MLPAISGPALENIGVSAVCAENGQEGLRIFQESPIYHFSAILMDIRMPVMGGCEATRTIRSLERADADIPIIAMTADAFEESIQAATSSGMNGYLTKPIVPENLYRLLNGIMSDRNCRVST